MPNFAAEEGVRAGGGGGGGSGLPDLPECLKRAMGGNCYPCIFEQNDSDLKQVQLLALYPPAGSVPSKEYDNLTSMELAKIFLGYYFQWNDLFPFVPARNDDVNQALLMKLLLDGKICNLVDNFHLRMLGFISSEQNRHRRPVVIVCGRIANKAFQQFKISMPSSVISISTFKILQYKDFTAMVDVPHPSAHLMTGRLKQSVEVFQDAFSIARVLNEDPHANCDTIFSRVSEATLDRHKKNAEAIETLELPGCINSWFSIDYRHLRYVDWAVVLPILTTMRLRITKESVWHLLQCNGLAMRLSDPTFTSFLNHWLGVLGEDRFITFMCDSVAKRLVDPTFTSFLNHWLGVLGEDRFITFMCNSVAKRLVDPTFTARLDRWLGELGKDRFITFMCGSVAKRLMDDEFDDCITRWLPLLGPAKLCTLLNTTLAPRWRCLGDFVHFYARVPYWGQRMSNKLASKIPIHQTELVDPQIYHDIAANS